MTKPKGSRNKLIDCTRGVCILMVILYHFGVTDFFSKIGLYGVLIFFIISGYCMVNSIRTSDTIWIFLKKRFFRLLPALIVCGFISTVLENMFPYAIPENLHSFSDYTKTVLFLPFLNIPSRIIGIVVDGFNNYKMVDGSYWSLVVEFKFYYLLAVLYFFITKKAYGFLLVLFSFLAILAIKIGNIYNFHFSSLIVDFVEYLPYFTIGIGINKMHFSKDKKNDLPIILLSIAILVFAWLIDVRAFSQPFTTAALLVTLVATCWIYTAGYIKLTNKLLDRFLSLLEFIGKISYPLYLLHQDIGLVLIRELSGIVTPLAAKAIVFAGLVFLAYLISKYIENILHNKVTAIKSTI